MYIDPYETLSAKHYKTKEIKDSIKKAQLSDELDFALKVNGEIINNLMMVTPKNEDVESFPHPIKVDLRDKDQFVIDARPFIKMESDGSNKITNVDDYKFLIIRGSLSREMDLEPASLLSVGDFPKTIFTRWISSAITNRLGLNPEEQIKVTTVTLFYFYSLFRDEEFEEQDKINILKKLSKVSYIPLDKSMEMIDQLYYMGGLNEFVDALKTITGSVRLSNLNVGMLLTMLGNSWFGFNAKEIIAVSLEHPPTFNAILIMALESRSYKKSVLGRLVHDNDKRGSGKEFQKSIYTLID